MEHPLQKPCADGQLPITAALWALKTEDLALFISVTTEEPPSVGAQLLQPHPQ